MKTFTEQPRTEPSSQGPNDESLPTSRKLLTSLFNAIATIPLEPDSDTSFSDSEGADTDSRSTKARKSRLKSLDDTKTQTNPLRKVPQSHRSLLVTLHALFPGMVLPALDLLERGLIGRVVLDLNEGGNGKKATVKRETATERDHRDCELGHGHESQSKDHTHDAGQDTASAATAQGNEKGKKHQENAFYLVTSASALEELERRRRQRKWHGRRADVDDDDDEDGDGMAVRRYIVRLEAWHCTCAAFAFASYGQGNAVSWTFNEVEQVTGRQGEQGGDAEGDGLKEVEWSFGGLSLDGLEGESAAGESVPMCKHLLACLLAERWSTALGRYVVDKKVGREEMAGIVADA
ncbi:uncharacterized protein CTHT_0005010 [Thermochaetoides thermophila DSM 1495]|uniref:SWIM-type domain-containing protein n=1 Tax=Chaetomium thermophilum (strain DSM 1495 / CBS 144.50 / IMI 039719) TaxID=759272 RepID=G0RY11_CHATD|nr:hypothetical protein CTHT_0005010 [Thermochaetoides thermophila DSM 1495]EGS23797.1 hypothetical protein CTHT_0005010 [Thermochaetoides thermophila DSM 1495]